MRMRSCKFCACANAAVLWRLQNVVTRSDHTTAVALRTLVGDVPRAFLLVVKKETSTLSKSGAFSAMIALLTAAVLRCRE